MATTVKLTHIQQIVGHLLTIGTSCTFVSCLTRTPQNKYLRKDCPYKGVVKVARRTGWLNLNYVTAVRRRLAERLEVPMKDVDYTPGETWHRHLTTGEGKLTPVLVHKTKYDENAAENDFYMYLTQGKTGKARYFLPSGEEISYDLLKPYFYSRGEQDDLKPVVRAFKLNNVAELRARGLIVQTKATAKVQELLAA
jgi:hypothetical protein